MLLWSGLPPFPASLAAGYNVARMSPRLETQARHPKKKVLLTADKLRAPVVRSLRLAEIAIASREGIKKKNGPGLGESALEKEVSSLTISPR